MDYISHRLTDPREQMNGHREFGDRINLKTGVCTDTGVRRRLRYNNNR